MPFKNRQLENIQFKNSNYLELNQFYKQHKEKSRARSTDSIYVAIEDDVIQCGLRLLSYDDFYFLRSVFTAPNSRNQGIASKLLIHTINDFSQPIYTLPTQSAADLYRRLGFKAVELADIPTELAASYRRFRHSSEDSTVMVINK